MKKSIKIFILLSSLAALATGCTKDNLTDGPEQKGLSITMIAEAADTKTSMNGTGDNVIWTGTDKLNIYLDGVHHIAKRGGITQEVLPDGKLKMTINGVSAAPETINGFIGAETSSKVQIGSGSDAQNPVKAFGIVLPAAQTITSKTFDHLADALVMEEKNVGGHDFTQAITGIRYHRLHAISRLDFTNMTESDGETVRSVAFTAVDGTGLAGNFRYDFRNRTFLDNAPQDPASSDHLIFADGASSTITMTYSDQPVVTGGKLTAWMVIPAIALPASSTIQIKITTDKHIFTKENKIPAEVPMSNLQLNILNIDMTGMQSSDATDQSVYKLVTRVEEVQEGGEYYLCSAENKVFNGELPKGAEGLSLTADTLTINPDNTVSGFTTGQALILEKGVTKGTFKMKMPGKESKDAFLSIGTKKGNGKLAFTNSSNSTSWTISIDGNAGAVITDDTKQIFSYSTYLQAADKTGTGTLPKLIMKSTGEIVPGPLPEPLPDPEPAPVWAERAVRNVVYIQTPTCNPLNILEYKLEDGTPFFDAVILFSANIQYEKKQPEGQQLTLKYNRNVRQMLTEQKTFLQPLRDAGIKVYLGLLGPGEQVGVSADKQDPSGLCQLSDRGAKEFAKYLADFCRKYNLDGINLDDEYYVEPPADHPLFANAASAERGARLAYELKKELTATCPWKTEVSVFAYKKFKQATSVKDLETGKVHQPGEFIDFQVGNYAIHSASTGGYSQGGYSYDTAPYGGMTRKQCSASSIECQLRQGGFPDQIDFTKFATYGYGWVMWFAFNPDPEQVYDTPGRVDNYNISFAFPHMKKAAMDLYGKELMLPQNYYTVARMGELQPAPKPHPYKL